MKHFKLISGWALIVLVTLACGVANGIGGIVNGDKGGAVSELWSDVPKIDGLSKTDLDLPLPAKLALQGFIQSSSNGDGALDFISFKSSKNVSQISEYYSTSRMKEMGWNLKDQPGCTSGQQNGVSGGAVCFFGKENKDNSGTYLMVFAAEDSKTKETQIFYMRVDVKNLPTPTP